MAQEAPSQTPILTANGASTTRNSQLTSREVTPSCCRRREQAQMPVQVLAQQGSSKTWHAPETCLSTSKADADTLLVEELVPPSHLQEAHPGESHLF